MNKYKSQTRKLCLCLTKLSRGTRGFLYFGLPGFSVTSHNNPHSTKDAMTDGKNAYLDSRGVMRAESKQKLHFRLIAVISQNDS